MELKTDTGDITLETIAAALRVQSSTGDVDVLHMPELRGDVWIATDTGDVLLSVEQPPQAARMQLHSDTGDVQVEWPQTAVRDAGPLLTVRTATGDIRIQ